MTPLQRILAHYAEFVDYWTDGHGSKGKYKEYNALEADADIKELFMAQLEPVKKYDEALWRRLRQQVKDL